MAFETPTVICSADLFETGIPSGLKTMRSGTGSPGRTVAAYLAVYGVVVDWWWTFNYDE